MKPAAAIVLGAGVLAVAAAAMAHARTASTAEAHGHAGALDPWAEAWGDPWGTLTDAVSELTADWTPEEAAGAITTEGPEGEDYFALLDDYLTPAAYQVGALFMDQKRIMSPAGLALLQRHEGWRPNAYRDPVGIWTIGYGHRIKPGESFGTLTHAEGVALLARDVNIAEAAVNAAVRVPLNQGQFDALVSFAFNVGVGAFRKSTLLKLLNAGEYAAVPAQLARWRFGTRNGVKVELAGLVARRADEGQLFAAATGDYA